MKFIIKNGILNMKILMGSKNPGKIEGAKKAFEDYKEDSLEKLEDLAEDLEDNSLSTIVKEINQLPIKK